MPPLQNKLKQILDELGYSLSQNLISQTGGYTHEVFEACTNKGNYIIKVSKHVTEDSLVLERTEYFMKKMYEKKIIDTKVITSGKMNNGVHYFIIEKLDGKVLSTEIEKEQLTGNEIFNITKDAIKNSNRISNIKMKGHGRIKKEKDEFKGWCDTELEEVKKTLEELNFLKDKKLIKDQHCQKIRTIIAENNNLFDFSDPRLVFPDVHFGNIIIKNKEFKGLIDFDWILSGDPVRSFISFISFIHNSHAHSNGQDIHTIHKKEILRARGLNKRQTKKLHLHTLLSNLSAMGWFFKLGEKTDKNRADLVFGQRKPANSLARSFVDHYLFHKQATEALLNILT